MFSILREKVRKQYLDQEKKKVTKTSPKKKEVLRTVFFLL